MIDLIGHLSHDVIGCDESQNVPVLPHFKSLVRLFQTILEIENAFRVSIQLSVVIRMEVWENEKSFGSTRRILL